MTSTRTSRTATGRTREIGRKAAIGALGLALMAPLPLFATPASASVRSAGSAHHKLIGGPADGATAHYSAQEMEAATPLDVSPGRRSAFKRGPKAVTPLQERALPTRVAPVSDLDDQRPTHLGSWNESWDGSWDDGSDDGWDDAWDDGWDPTQTSPDPAPAPSPEPAPAPAPTPAPAQASGPTRVAWGTDLGNVATRTEGRIFFTSATDGKTHSCSGTVVNSANQSLVWTAGHCVHGGAGSDFHTDFVFVPAYDNGNTPYGQFSARERWTTNTWASIGGQHGPFNEDFGALILNGDASGYSVMQVVDGAQGIIFNQSATQSFVDLGYPADAPFDGSTLYACIATTSDIEVAADGATPVEIGIPCDMTGGSSGGGWIIGMDSSGLGYVNTVNSFGPQDRSRLWGAYQGPVAQELYQTVQGR